MSYQPLVLKKVKSTPDVKVQTGLMTHDDVPVAVQVQRVDGRSYYVVFVRVGGEMKIAGLVHVHGVGRWGVQSYGADSQPHTTVNGSGTKVVVQPNGYAESGTLANAVEHVVHEFLGSVEYVAREAAKTPQQRDAEAQAKSDSAYVLGAVDGFVARDKADRGNRFEAWMDSAGVDSDQREAFLAVFNNMAR